MGAVRGTFGGTKKETRQLAVDRLTHNIILYKYRKDERYANDEMQSYWDRTKSHTGNRKLGLHNSTEFRYSYVIGMGGFWWKSREHLGKIWMKLGE